MKITLNLKTMQSPEAVHSYPAAALSLPPYYGKNLDALYDVLTDCDRPAVFRLRLPETGDMAAYGRRLLTVFQDAAAVNARISVEG